MALHRTRLQGIGKITYRTARYQVQHCQSAPFEHDLAPSRERSMIIWPQQELISRD